MLDVELQSGVRLRFEKYADTGLLATMPSAVQASKGNIYRGRTVTAKDLVRSWRAGELQQLAKELGSKPYCLLSANCHHFVRDMWNHLVITPLHRYSHPDRLKGSMLLRLSVPFQKLHHRGGCLESRSLRSLGTREVYHTLSEGSGEGSG